MGNKKSTVLKCSCEKDLKGEKAKCTLQCLYYSHILPLVTHYEIAILEKIYTDLAGSSY